MWRRHTKQVRVGKWCGAGTKTRREGGEAQHARTAKLEAAQTRGCADGAVSPPAPGREMSLCPQRGAPASFARTTGTGSSAFAQCLLASSRRRADGSVERRRHDAKK